MLIFSRIQTRTIHSSVVWQQLPKHPLYPKIDWETVAAGHYAVIDPFDKHAILYLTDREYKVQVRVSQSQDSSLVVLARPLDVKVSTPSDSPPEEGPPLPKRSAQGRWRKFLRWHISRLTSLVKDDKNGEVVVVPSAEMLMTIVPYWGFTASYWGGGPLKPSSSLRRSVFQIARHFVTILKSQGTRTLILRMKNALFMLNRYLAAQEGRDAWLLGTPVGLTKAGLPSFIPVALRRRISSGDKLAIRVVATILQGYKAFDGPHDYQLLETITAPHPELCPHELRDFAMFCKNEFWSVVRQNAGDKEWSNLVQLHFRMREDDIPHTPFSAGPNRSPAIMGVLDDALAWSLQPINWPALWATHVNDVRSLDLMFKVLAGVDDTGYHPIRQLHVGKVALLPEPAGKVRTVAIVDYWTQRLMLPVHQWMMRVLRALPTDATFDQQGRLKEYAQKFSECKHYSIDLKSATDLIPIELYRTVFEGLWPTDTVDLWISLMTDRWFHVPKGNKKSPSLARRCVQGTDIMYQRGQPMGALSSWASMAIVHHALVLYSARRAGLDPGTFSEYRVLGDDLVMANGEVRSNYLEVTTRLCVPTSPAKTLEGKLFIFASQAYREGVNLSPLSLKEELGITTFAQRVEMALRAVDRGWAGDGDTPSLARFLRLLLSHRDYRASVKQFSKGKLGTVAQAALASALGAFGRVSDRLGLQGVRILPFLNALANKVEVLAHSQSGLRSGGLAAQLGEVLREIDLVFGIRTVQHARSELKSMIDTLWLSSTRFSEWREGIVDTGILPVDTRPGPAGDGGRPKGASDILCFPERRDRETPYWLNKWGPIIGPPTEDQYQSRLDYGTAQQWMPLWWLVIEDTYTPIFGCGGFDELDAEEDGMGMSWSPEGTRVSPSSGRLAPIPRLVTDVEGILNRVDSTLARFVKATPEDLAEADYSAAMWSEVRDIVDLIAKLRRLPAFRTVGDFMKTTPASVRADNLRDWTRRMYAYRKVMQHWPLHVSFRIEATRGGASSALDSYLSNALGLEQAEPSVSV